MVPRKEGLDNSATGRTVLPSQSQLRTLLVAFVVATAAVGALAVGAASAHDGVHVTAENVTVNASETNATNLTLDEAPEGVSGFNATLAVENTSVATIDNASVGENFSEQSTANVSENGTNVSFEAVDLNDQIGANATNVTLATLTVNGTAAGETTLVVENATVSGDDGAGNYNVSAQNGTITVEAAEGNESSENSTDASGGAADDDSMNATATPTEDGGGAIADNGTATPTATATATETEGEATATPTDVEATPQQTDGTGPTVFAPALAVVALLGLGLRLRE